MSKQPVYGFPCVTDPNDFVPDGESCSAAEIEVHRLACANFGKPNFKPNKGCVTDRDESGQIVRHVLRTSWGIGVNLIPTCDSCRDPLPASLIACHECGGQEYCGICWPAHETRHDEEAL